MADSGDGGGGKGAALIGLGGAALQAWGAKRAADQARADSQALLKANRQDTGYNAQTSMADQRSQTNANLYNQQLDSRQAFGKNAMDTATSAQDFMANQAKRSLMGSIIKGLPGAYGQAPLGGDFDKRLQALLSQGAETSVLRNMNDGRSMLNPLGAAISPSVYGLQGSDGEFAGTQNSSRTDFLNTENAYRAKEMDNLNLGESDLKAYLQTIQAAQAQEDAKKNGSTAGSRLGGAAKGAAAGAAVGSVVPIIGTGLGALAGGIIGAFRGK